LGLEVKQSFIPNSGLGLFASKDFSKGETICTYGGKRVTNLDNIPASDYLLDNSATKSNPILLNADTSTASLARYANDLNSTFKAVDSSKYNTAFRRHTRYKGKIVAKKNIKAGEEIYVDYGRRYWKQKSIK